jgi:hypothetical protein
MAFSVFRKLIRPVALVLLPVTLLLLIHPPASARQLTADQTRSSNVRWTKKNDVIIINYDLLGQADAKYDVRVVMKKDKDPSFVFTPKNIEGHIGEGVSAGTDREIRWYFRTEYTLRIQSDECYFEIQVRKMDEPSHLLYYIAGGAALVGGVLGIILSKNQSGGPELVSTLALPPARP